MNAGVPAITSTFHLRRGGKQEKQKGAYFSFCKILFFYTERGREGRKEGEKHQSVASCTHPVQGWNLQPIHMSWPGIELATFRFAGWCPTNWATPVKAGCLLLSWVSFLQVSLPEDLANNHHLCHESPLSLKEAVKCGSLPGYSAAPQNTGVCSGSHGPGLCLKLQHGVHKGPIWHISGHSMHSQYRKQQTWLNV